MPATRPRPSTKGAPMWPGPDRPAAAAFNAVIGTQPSPTGPITWAANRSDPPSEVAGEPTTAPQASAAGRRSSQPRGRSSVALVVMTARLGSVEMPTTLPRTQSPLPRCNHGSGSIPLTGSRPSSASAEDTVTRWCSSIANAVEASMPPPQLRATTEATAGSVIETSRSLSKGTSRPPLTRGSVAAGALRPSSGTPPAFGVGVVVVDPVPFLGAAVITVASRSDASRRVVELDAPLHPATSTTVPAAATMPRRPNTSITAARVGTRM